MSAVHFEPQFFGYRYTFQSKNIRILYTGCPRLTRPTFIFATVSPRCIHPITKVLKIRCRIKILKVWSEKKISEKLQNLNFYIAPRSLHSYLEKSCPYKNITNRKSSIFVRAIFTEILNMKFSDLNHFSLVIIYIFSGYVHKMKYRKKGNFVWKVIRKSYLCLRV